MADSVYIDKRNKNILLTAAVFAILIGAFFVIHNAGGGAAKKY